MRSVTVGITLLVALVACATAQTHSQSSISVSFAIDGKPASCTPFGVELNLDGEIIKPNHTGQKFVVPRAFNKPSSQWRDDQHVEISLTCNEHTFVFPKVHPAFVRESDWELGIARPPYSIEQFRRTGALESGTWLSYLEFPGEPGVLIFISQPDPPSDYVEALRKEQPNASGERETEIAYALAVFGIEYQTNRDSLLLRLSDCLSELTASPEDDGCDRTLLDFVTNLYWRGDDALLAPLLRMAGARRAATSELGTFYSDLLDRRGSGTLEALGTLSAEKQQMVCKSAYEDDLGRDTPERDRVLAFLRGSTAEAAARCLSALSQ